MKKTELRKAMNEYQQLAVQIAQLEKQKAAVADRIKAHMDAAGVDEMQIDDATARYKEVTSNRFDSKAFKAEHADLYSQYSKQTTATRFILSV